MFFASLAGRVQLLGPFPQVFGFGEAGGLNDAVKPLVLIS